MKKQKLQTIVIFFIFSFLSFASSTPSLLRINNIIEQAQQNILKLDAGKNYWNLYNNLGTPYFSQYYLYTKYMRDFQTFDIYVTKALRDKLIKDQKEDGSWFYVNDSNLNSGQLGASIINYMALKVMGTPLDKDVMVKARNYINQQGGITQAPLFTKIFLSLFSNSPWSEVPILSSVIFKKGPHHPFLGADHFGQWIAPHLLPIVYLKKNKVIKNLGTIYSLQEISQNADFSKMYAKSLLPGKDKKASPFLIKKLLKSQRPQGSYGGYTLATMLSNMAFEHYLHHAKSTKRHIKIRQAMKKGDLYLKEINFPNGKPNFLGTTCDGRFWDTALLGLALARSGHSGKKLNNATEYLIANQSVNGGFPFGFDFWRDPDTDDTAEIMMLIQEVKGKETFALKKAFEFQINMQNRDDGWGAFAKNNNGNILSRRLAKRFLDSADLFDESSADVTGHVLEALGHYGFNIHNAKFVKKAVTYLRKDLAGRPMWQGRWGVNTIYGTNAAVVGLTSVGVPTTDDMIVNAANWLRQKQNTDGGFGETTLSYIDIDFAAIGVSTPTQTAWAITTLMYAGDYKSDQVIRGIDYLLNEFEKHHKWIDQSIVGTGHPEIVYMDYPSYAYAFPLMTLAQYAKYLSK